MLDVFSTKQRTWTTTEQTQRCHKKQLSCLSSPLLISFKSSSFVPIVKNNKAPSVLPGSNAQRDQHYLNKNIS